MQKHMFDEVGELTSCLLRNFWVIVLPKIMDSACSGYS